jgi:acetylornithine aminotransferase
MSDEGLLANAERQGQRIRASLKSGLEGVSAVRDIRGQGLMIGVELDRPCGMLVAEALKHGLVMNVTQDCVIRLLPPLIINQEEADQMAAIVVQLVKALVA